MKTFSASAKENHSKWFLVDANGMVLGRLASQIALILRGKHKPSFTPNIDVGDNVVVINASKVHLTGNKLDKKIYYWHTGYPGGLKKRTAGEIITGPFPERVLHKAVQRMMPKGPLARQQLTKLRIYCGPDHPHVAQNPESLDLATRNPKNVRRT